MVNLSNLWDNLRRSFTIRLRKTRSKGNPPSIKEVAPENDLWDALPLDDQIFFHCPKAKADAVTGISSLPVEILELILEYCNIHSARSLIRTNRTLYSLALRRLYADVFICVPWRSFPAGIEDMEIMKILGYLVTARFSVLGALLRRPEHMALLQHLYVVKFPLQGKYFLHKVIQYILDYAVSIQS